MYFDVNQIKMHQGSAKVKKNIIGPGLKHVNPRAHEASLDISMNNLADASIT